MFSANASQVSTAANYIEDVFSTYLYTGNGSTQTITNGIDLATKGGLVWCKNRAANTFGSESHEWYDTVRGTGYGIFSNATSAQQNYGSTRGVTAFNTNGFTVTNSSSLIGPNANNITEVGWTFAKTPKFFDVVTWTATGSEIVSHNLQSVPGFVVYKSTSNTSNWLTLARKSDGTYAYGMSLNLTNASSGSVANAAAAGLTSTTFDPSQVYGTNPGQTYVGYFFAHNAGGFGLTGTDNVITCGSFDTDGSTTTIVNLGYEPQWILIKQSNGTKGWYLLDTMRGLTANANGAYLLANSSAAEGTNSAYSVALTSTGFQVPTSSNFNNPSESYIYIAIRRGPMAVPTTGTSVFSPNVSAASTGTAVTTNFPIDLQIQSYQASPGNNFVDRLRGVSSTSTESGVYVRSVNTNAEASGSVSRNWDNTSFQITSAFSGGSTVYWNMRRAPSFFDAVCWTTDGVSNNERITHNLTVAPELIIAKTRGISGTWFVYAASQGRNSYASLNTSGAFNALTNAWGTSNPTSTDFGFDSLDLLGTSTTMVGYLFATCAGVSKVGSYSGNGTTQTINCGFTGGARFVLIKRTDSSGGWYVYDTARGMTTLTDPYLLLNSAAAESATLGSVTTVTTGFAVNASILAAINTNGASYIFLAIA